jgi:hypothetical protein
MARGAQHSTLASSSRSSGVIRSSASSAKTHGFRAAAMAAFRCAAMVGPVPSSTLAPAARASTTV